MGKTTIIGNGFVGSAVANVLSVNGREYCCLGSKEFNLCDLNTWSSLPDDTQTVVIAAGVITEDVTQLELVNEKPVDKLCAFLKQRGVTQLVVLSTAAVYGNYAGDRHTELECNPCNNYGASRLKAEKLFCEHWGSDLNLLRLFFPYGAAQKLPRLMPRLIHNIQNGLPISINKDGGPVLSLSHIDDLAEVIYSDFICINNKGLLHNVASGYKISISDLATKLSQYIGKDPVFEHAPEAVSNCSSLPYKHSWSRTGEFASLFI